MSDQEKTLIIQDPHNTQLDKVIADIKQSLDAKQTQNIPHLLSQLPSLDMIISILEVSDNMIADKIVQNLESLRIENSLVILTRALQSTNSYIRKRCIYGLGKIGTQDALNVLLKHLDDADETSIIAIVSTLKDLAKNNIAMLMKAFDTPNSRAKFHVAYALWEIGDEQAEAKLIAALHSDDPDVCGTAALALGKIGGAKATRALLKSLLLNHDKIQQEHQDFQKFNLIAVQAQIASALVEVGQPAVVSLVNSLQNATEKLKIVIVSVLGKIGCSSIITVLIEIIEQCQQGEEKLLLETLKAAAYTPSSKLLPILTKVLVKHPQKTVYELAIKAISSIPDPKADSVLMRLLDHTDAAIRFYAIIAINHRGMDSAVPKLSTMLDDVSPLVASQATNALEKFGGSYLPFLLHKVTSENNDKIAKILKNIGTNAILALERGKNSSNDPQKILTQFVDFSIKRNMLIRKPLK